MELKDFITASLENIADGIIESNIKLLNKGFIVSPSASRVNNRTTHQIPLVQDIRFNVYVEENNETNVSGKGGLRVLSAGMNAKTEGKYGNSLLKRRLNIFQTKIKAAIVAAIYTRIYKVAAIINQSNIIMYVLNSMQI
mgnify:CR=1 FL=1